MRRLLFLVGALVFVDTMFFAALTPLLPHYTEQYDLSKAGAGLLAAAYPAGVLLGGIPSGLVSVRIGVKPTVVAGVTLMAITTVVFGFAGSIELLLAARFAQGLASALTWSAGQAWLVAASPPDRRGEMIGSTLGAAIVGALFGPVLGGIASVAGPRPTFAGVGAIAVGLGLWALATDAPGPRGTQSLRRLRDALRDRRVQAGVWLVALPALLFGTLSVLAPLRLSELGFGAVGIGAVFLTGAAFEAVLAPALGRFSDRRGRRLPILAALTASAALTALLPWPSRGWVLAVLVVLAAIGFGTFWAPAMSLLSDSAERVGLEHALAFALANVAWAPGQALGAAGGGALARATADAVPYLLLCAACLLTLATVRRA
jgi:MFS family permease